MKKNVLVLLAAAGLSYPAMAFNFNPTLSLVSSYTATAHDTRISSGNFALVSSSFNTGFELTQDIPVAENLYQNRFPLLQLQHYY